MIRRILPWDGADTQVCPYVVVALAEMTSEEFNQRIHHILQIESPKEAFFRLCDLYLIVSAEQRKEIRQNYFFERDWEAPEDRALAAHIPGEPDREARIRASLILLSLAEEEDFRDGLVTAAVIWNSLKDIGKDADGWFRYFADMSSAIAASIMNNFQARSQEEKELNKWGWEREITEHGIVYINKMSEIFSKYSKRRE